MLTDSLRVKLGDFGIARLFNSADSKKQLLASNLPEIDMDSSIRRRDVSLTTSYRQKVSFLLNLIGHRGQNTSLDQHKRDRNSAPSSIYSDLEMTSNCGTVRFMAPEVAGADDGLSKYSRQADIWSVGLVYYYIFERVRPSIPGCNNSTKHVIAILKGRRPPFIRTRPAMQEIINHCLAMDKKQRPTAEDLVDLLLAVPLVRPFPLCCMKVNRLPAAVKKAATVQERLTP